MKTLEECKDEVARNHGMINWLHVLLTPRHPLINWANEAAELYAQSIREHYEAKLKEKESQIFALERFRREDAFSAINEANELRERLKEKNAEIERLKVMRVQVCPKCNGEGVIPNDNMYSTTALLTRICPVCSGKKIL